MCVRLIYCRPVGECPQEMEGISDLEEDILTYVLFPQIALKYFEYRQERPGEDQPQIIVNDEVGKEAEINEVIIKKPLPTIRKKKSPSGGDEEMNLDELRELILMLDQTSISELEVQKDNFKISLRKGSVKEQQPGTGWEAPQPASKEVDIKPVNQNLVEVLSPMVGTFYSAPSPDAPAYAKAGDHVKKGQTLCIVEAMKLMNEIKAEYDGIIIEVAVENAEAVEYDQVLFVIERD